MKTSILSFAWQYTKPYKWFYGVMMLAPILSSFYGFFCNYSVKLFIDAMTAEQVVTYQSLWRPIALFMGAQFLQDIYWRISNIAEWKSLPYVRQSIMLDAYNYVQHHSYRFFQDNLTGALSSKIKGLVEGYDKLWGDLHHGVFQNIMRTCVGIVSLMFVNGYLALLIIVWTFFYALYRSKMSPRMVQLASDEMESFHEAVGQVSDNITNIFSLFSFASRSRELNNLRTYLSENFIPKNIRTVKYHCKLGLIDGFLYLILYGGIVALMIHLRQKGEVSLGDFAFVFGISISVAEDIWYAGISLQDLTRAMGNFKSCLSILKVAQDDLDLPDARPLVVREPSIDFQNVTFGHTADSFLFKDLNLKIKAGEKVGLVGHSGAGKSSIVSLLLRYFQPLTGRILISDQDIRTVTQDSLREAISLIPQDIMLFHRTLLENIRYGRPHATDQEVREACKLAHVHDFIMELPEQYNTYVGERGVKLSGGQRQRIAIARAILKNSPILILDEATSSLDSQTEKLIQESLHFLMKNKKTTVIAIAHRLSTLKHMDRIIVLDKGVVREEGTHDSLLQKPKSYYKHLWELQELR